MYYKHLYINGTYRAILRMYACVQVAFVVLALVIICLLQDSKVL